MRKSTHQKLDAYEGLNQYRLYIEENLERIARGEGWVPVCLAEFLDSDEASDGERNLAQEDGY